MPTSQTNETYTQNYIRAFTQRGGPGPNNPVRYAGADEQYLMVGDISAPERGGINAINVQDPRVRGLYKRTGITIDAPDIPSNSITFKQRRGGLPWYKFRLNCPISIYESIGFCNDPSDPINGWESLSVLSAGLATDKSYTGRTVFDGADETLAEIGFSWMGGVYDLGAITMGERGAADVTTEVVDIVYGAPVRCPDCGPANDGSDWIYALQQTAGGSSAVVGKVLYSTDGGATWTASALTGLGVGVLVTAIDIVGSYLVVIAKSENAYYVSPINQLTGAPGSWTKVTAGFVSTKTPNDIFVLSPTEVFFAADGGYLYKSTNILAGVQVSDAGSATTADLLRIHGTSEVLVAVGASRAVKSVNRGDSWATTTTNPTGTVQAVAVLGPLAFYVGNSAGLVQYTLDGGATWTTLTLPGATLAGIQDIVFPTLEAGWIATTRTGPTAALFATCFGGAIWGETNTSRIPSLPTFGRANRLAFPNVADPAVAANNLALAGLGGGLIDGIVLVGSAPVF